MSSASASASASISISIGGSSLTTSVGKRRRKIEKKLVDKNCCFFNPKNYQLLKHPTKKKKVRKVIIRRLPSTRGHRFFEDGPFTVSFSFIFVFCLHSRIILKNLAGSKIRTWIIGAEIQNADHWTTSTAQNGSIVNMGAPSAIFPTSES